MLLPCKGRKFTLFCTNSYGFWDGGKFTFSRSCDLEGHVTLKSKNRKFTPFCSISNRFWDKCKFKIFELFKIFDFFWNFWNVQKCFAVIIDRHCDHQISSVSLYLVRFLSFKFKFKNWIFLKWPPFGQFWPDFFKKLISTSFQCTGCSYKILNHFIQLFVLYRRHKIFFKL